MNCVYVVQNDSRKDFSDAERFGQLKEVFGNVSKNYDTHKMINHARRIFRNWKEGDAILMIGDPALCAVCVTVVAEQFEVVDVLKWDRYDMCYKTQTLNFYMEDEALTAAE